MSSSLFIGAIFREKVLRKISLNQMKDYDGFILRLQERKDVETWISPLFNAGFFKWRWKVNLVLRWPGERQELLGIFSLDGPWSDTAPVDQESQRDYKHSLTCMQQVVWIWVERIRAQILLEGHKFICVCIHKRERERVTNLVAVVM